MPADLKQICEESIKLEQNISTLYRHYSTLYHEDDGFWQSMQMEEDVHASILDNLMKVYLPMGCFPQELVDGNLENIRQANLRLKEAIAVCAGNPLSAEAAYRFAVEMEESCTEFYYQQAMTLDSESRILETVKKMNGDSKDHAIRIRALIGKRGFRE